MSRSATTKEGATSSKGVYAGDPMACREKNPLLALALLALLGCDRGAKTDPNPAEATAPPPTVATTAAPPGADTNAAPPALSGAPPGTSTVGLVARPVITDGGKLPIPTDAGGVVPPPVPTSTFAIPPIPSNLKPPAGFPSALPSNFPAWPTPPKK